MTKISNPWFDPIRNYYGQEFLLEYNEWSIKDFGSPWFFGRMDYFSLDSPKLKEFIKEKHPEING
jgi:hypothetical protein